MCNSSYTYFRFSVLVDPVCAMHSLPGQLSGVDRQSGFLSETVGSSLCFDAM